MALQKDQSLTLAAATDYGLCVNMYHKRPTTQQFESLIKAYVFALELHGTEWLHQHLREHNLRAALAHLLDSRVCLDWVAFMNE